MKLPEESSVLVWIAVTGQSPIMNPGDYRTEEQKQNEKNLSKTCNDGKRIPCGICWFMWQTVFLRSIGKKQLILFKEGKL